MTGKSTMTLNLSSAEMRVLEDLASKKELNKTAVIKQALRLYQIIDVRLDKGEKFYFEDIETKEKAEFLVI